MKCTDKTIMNRQRNERSRQIKKKVFRVLLSIIVFLSVILAVILIRNASRFRAPMAYDRSRQVFGSAEKESALLAKGIAENLCVGEDNTAMEGIRGIEEECSGFFDIQNKSILYSRNMHEKISPGRITQLMTVLTAWSELDMEEVVEIGVEDVVGKFSGISSGLSAGNKITVQQLINAVLVYSAEDACLALARAAGGSRDSFVEQMNQKAQELGMTNTHFVNVAGRSDVEQYTTVYDCYLLFHQLLLHEELTNAMGLSGYVMNCDNAKGELKQTRLDSDNPYLTGRLSVPKNVTILGGKFMASSKQNMTALLVQNQYGNVFVLIVSGSDSERSMNTRIWEMLEKVNSKKVL